MGYYDFPHTRNYDSDLGFLIEKYKELHTTYNNLVSKDEFNTTINTLQRTLEKELNDTIKELEQNYNVFVDTVNNSVILMNGKIIDLNKKIDDYYISANAYTDTQIERNNEILIEKLSNSVSNYYVINYFTGEKITIQDMFNYLSKLHLENYITLNEVLAKNKTLNELFNLKLTLSQVLANGKILIN